MRARIPVLVSMVADIYIGSLPTDAAERQQEIQSRAYLALGIARIERHHPSTTVFYDYSLKDTYGEKEDE